jgi:hypothetical protein
VQKVSLVESKTDENTSCKQVGFSVIDLLNSWRESPAIPKDWVPENRPGSVVKVPVKNSHVLNLLREALPGKWMKVYRLGKDSTEVHYFEHRSGKVAFVKHKRKGHDN